MSTQSTQSDEAVERAVPDLVLLNEPDAETRPPARAKLIVTTVAQRSRDLGRHWLSQASQTTRELGVGGLAQQQPASPAELRAYIHSAAWVPGEVPVLEWLGRLYGYALALPLSLALYALAWLVQRPGRALVTGFIATVIWLTV